MTAGRPDTSSSALPTVDRTTTWWDPGSDCSIVLAHPASEPELWTDYVRGAQLSYWKHGVERALDITARHSDSTALFCVGLNDAGTVVGGVRAKGPYTAVDECHAVEEWSGQAGLDAVRKMVGDRLPFGVVEIKSAWVTDHPERSRALTDVLARFPLHSSALLDARFAVATAAAYVLNRWLSAGGVLAAAIPATPYPDARYQTRMMWWDRRTFANHADPKQLSTILAESRVIAARRDGMGELASAGATP